MSIKIDLQYVKKLLEHLERHKDDDLLNKSYWISSVIIYGKCFTNASKGRGTTLNKENIFKLKPKLKQFHDELMEMRNNYVAHAGDSVFEKIEPRIRLDLRGDALYPHLVYQGYSTSGFDDKVTLLFIEVIDFLVKQIDDKTEAIGKLILKEEEKTKTKDEMLEATRLQRINDFL